MNRTLNRKLIVYIAIIGAHLLVSCGFKPLSNEPTRTPLLTINTVNDEAITYKAKYGLDYEIHGNVIAKFPHFNLSLFSQKTFPSHNDSIYIYELTSKDGFAKTHISCDTRHPEKKHFSLEGLHFYYHSNRNGSINIYIPQQLLAKN